MQYFKLGENASIFFDPSTHVLIRGKEVIAMESAPKSKKFGLARRSGHITVATEEEFLEYQKTLPEDKQVKAAIPVPRKPSKKDKPKKDEEDAYDYNPELLKLTPDEFRKRVLEEGFLDEDNEKFDGLSDIKEMIKLFDQINKLYTS